MGLGVFFSAPKLESMDSRSRLIIFVKVPTPGKVKTRLAASVGPDEACRIYRGLVEDLLHRMSRLAQVELRVAPAAEVESCRDWCAPGWRLRGQADGNLGNRLLEACTTAFSEGVERVILIGSDCPYLTLSDIEAAETSLAENDVVLGPAVDGGYWLIGMNRLIPALFESIDWSTHQVLQQTRNQADSVCARVGLIRVLEDVDDLDGWHRYLETKK